MSLRAVSQGVTDPKEVRILVRRGVKVFTRSNLHAKLLVMDQTLIVGSANASRNAAKVLDEAALVTRDAAAVQLALSFIDSISTEPVRPHYLRECLKAYRPPRFKSAIPHDSARNAKRERRAKLWIIGGLVPFDPPKAEEGKAESAKARAERLQRRPESTYVDQLFYPNHSRLIDGLKRGDWAVTGMREKNTITVWPPRQLLSIENYARGAGKQRWTLQLEAPNSEQSLTLSDFRRKMKGIVTLSGRALRTSPIYDVRIADAILRLWTPAGRVSNKRAGH